MNIITIFGNCQRFGVARVLRNTLNLSQYTINIIANSPRAGNMLNADEMDTMLSNSDIIIHQPLNKEHEFSTEKVASYPAKSIAFPYFFNSGTTSLGYAPMSPKHPYGEIFGADIILEKLKHLSLNSLLKEYKNHTIDFNLHGRFSHDLKALKKREKGCKVIVSDFIEQNYKTTFLFHTHNHPSIHVYKHIAQQVCYLIGEQYIDQPIEENIAPSTGQPISPYDVAIHGYTFGYHQNWYKRGERLIKILYDYHIMHDYRPREADSNLLKPLPDCK